MASPTNCYCDYATGNDYKGATFTDGAYTSATKTLVKNAAFAASQVNHWLYLESNDGGSIVAGYYKIATVSDANTVILATDAGAGVDDDAAKCTQHDGTTSKPWRSIQGALDLITRDATNGDQINVKAGTAQVLAASLSTTTYGTATESTPINFAGYTSTAGDGGQAEIDCNGVALFASGRAYSVISYLTIHNFGNNHGVSIDAQSILFHCEIHKGASSPSGKYLVSAADYNGSKIIGCYIHDAGTNGVGVYGSTSLNNYIYNCPTGIYMRNSSVVVGNIIRDCAVGIKINADYNLVANNSIYHSSASTGNGMESTVAGALGCVILNNIIEGYSGSGGKGIYANQKIYLLGYNAFYNNSTPQSLSDVILNLGNDVTLAASPFTDPAADDFSLKTSVAGAIEAAWPGAWPGLATTTAKADMGAVQKGAGAGTTDTLEVRAGIG